MFDEYLIGCQLAWQKGCYIPFSINESIFRMGQDYGTPSFKDWPVVQVRPRSVVRQKDTRTIQEHYHNFALNTQALQFFTLTQQRMRLFARSQKYVALVLDAAQLKRRDLYEGESDMVIVATDTFNIRLSDSRRLHEKTTIKLLRQSLRGLMDLVDVFGPNFFLSQRMIAVSQSLQATVWYNEDFSSPFKQFPGKKGIPMDTAEHGLLCCFFNLCERALSNSNCHYHFTSLLKASRAPYTFVTAMQVFYELQQGTVPSPAIQVRPARQDVTYLRSFSNMDRGELLTTRDSSQASFESELPSGVKAVKSSGKFMRNLINASDFTVD